MKKVVGSLPLYEVSLSECDSDHLYLAVQPPRGEDPIFYWILVYEPKGWIFRKIEDHSLGMCGFYSTLTSAIKSAFHVGSIYQFNSLQELVAYIQLKKP